VLRYWLIDDLTIQELKRLIFMRILPAFTILALIFVAYSPIQAEAIGLFGKKEKKSDIEMLLKPHKALYDINLVATRSGSQVINISGKMFYEWKPTCDAWITDHRFNLFYEYADSPGMKITSDFSTFETYNGESFNFSARRKQDNNLYEELRGAATIADKGGSANYTMPEDLKFELKKDYIFPMAHTVEMIRHAKENKKFFSAVVFDGSDDEGPVEINTFIGKKADPLKNIKVSKELDMDLLKSPAWNVRMAVFPTLNDEATSDYEMSMVFHENGVISDMLVEYDDFSVTQKLVALEPIEDASCGKKQNKSLKKSEKKQ
jgi:hypothetical protein